MMNHNDNQPIDLQMAAKGWSQPEGIVTAASPFWTAPAAACIELAAAGFFPTTGWVQQTITESAFDFLPQTGFEARPYQIRLATLADLPTLLHLEAECWIEPLQATAAELHQRIQRYPQGQYLLEMDSRVVGVIYSQRIVDAAALAESNFRDVAALHVADGPIVQPLAVNVLPAMQAYGLGDQLLEFLLQVATLQPDVARVVGVTLCQNYRQHSAMPMEAYIQLRNEHDQPVDPILNFHAAHGARISQVIDGYRPADLANQGKGVLVEYDLRTRLAGRNGRFQAAGAPLATAADRAALPAFVDEAIQTVLGPARVEAYTRQHSLMALGLTSMELLELRTLLSQRVGVEVEPTFFFRYGTAQAIIEYFQQGAKPHPAATPQPGQADHTLDRLQAQDTAHAVHMYEPIAIIGMACRFPGGVTTPAEFWSLLANGVDAITEVPKTRWDIDTYYGDGPGQIRTRYGGFIEPVDTFDASFFRIAPVEAAALDPQQRLLLETHWEALEQAGIAPDSLQGSKTGVYVGIFADDYKLLQAKQPVGLSTYFGTGTFSATAAGRIAYFLGLQGPALALDTACSSSLVALHLACQSLQRGESTLALASGVNLILSPELSIAFSQANMLAPDGRCKTFDAAADGYVRSEGCGVVVLKRLRDAQAAGDNILAVVRGSAINQDGASNGLTAPNGLAQEAVQQEALATAQVAPQTIDYIETHGTGTALGDPTEIQALETIYGPDRDAANPLLVGSVKTNIGHTEAAAGMAGLMKVVLALQNDQIPPHLHFQTINPFLATSQVKIPSRGEPWPVRADGQPRRAGISSFGFSGTNAHVIVEEAPPRVVATHLWRPYHLLTFGAQNEAALRALARHYASILSTADPADFADICATAATHRARVGHRLALVAATADEAQRKLLAYSQGEPASAHTALTAAPQAAHKIAFLFTGQGSQYLQMGRELYSTQPVFRRIMDECDVVARTCLGRSLIELLYPQSAPDHNDLMESHPCGQAATYAIECALVELWRAWGIVPDLVLGHSLGDFAAAYAAGVFSLADGLRLVTERGRLMETAQGDMVAVLAAEADVAPFVAAHRDVTIGVINGPQSVVISGGSANVALVAEQLSAAGFKTRKLAIPVAAHSPLLDPVLDEFEAVVRRVALAAPKRTVISSMTGKPVSTELTDPSYWRQHLRNTVRFADAVQTLYAQTCTIFIEIGPQDTLLKLASRVLETMSDAENLLYLPSLHPGVADWQQLLSSVGTLYTQGIPLDRRGIDHEYAQRRPELVDALWPDQEAGCSIDPAQAGCVDRPAHLLTLSAQSEAALHDLARRYQVFLAQPTELSLGDICATAQRGRSHFAQRLSIAAATVEEVQAKLNAYAKNETVAGLSWGHVTNATAAQKGSAIAFLFTGQGAQYVGMGRELYETHPIFRAAIDRCAALLQPLLDEPLLQVLYPESEDPTSEHPSSYAALIDQTAYTQPALFALEYALAELWQSWGIQPDIVMGHSVGELVAACVAGVFTLEDALKLVAARGRLMGALPQDGAMLSLLADEARVQAAIAPYCNDVSIAAINGPESVVISGQHEAVQAIATTLAAEGIITRPLNVSHAFHSPLMEPMLAAFAEVAHTISYANPKLRMISNVTGQLASNEVATPAYWVRHVREAVRFADGVESLYAQGIGIFLEIGPKPTLLGMVQQIDEKIDEKIDAQIDAQTTEQARSFPIGNRLMLPSLRGGTSAPRADWQQMMASLGTLYTQGVAIDWVGFNHAYPWQKVVLPTYPFQRQRHWIDAAPLAQASTHQLANRGQSPVRAQLGQRLRLPFSSEIRFEVQFSAQSPSYMADHRLFETLVVPAASHISMLLSAIKTEFKTDACIVEDLFFPKALLLSPNTAVTVQLVLTPNATDHYAFQIISLQQESVGNDETAWHVHASGNIRVDDTEPSSIAQHEQSHIARLREELADPEAPTIQKENFYDVIRQIGYTLGNTFCWNKAIRVQGDEAICQVEAPFEQLMDEYQLHPGLIDSCLQMLINFFFSDAQELVQAQQIYLPFMIERFHFYRPVERNQPLWCYAKLHNAGDGSAPGLLGDIYLFDDGAHLFAKIEGFNFRKAPKAVLLPEPEQTDLHYALSWKRKELATTSRTDQAGAWLIFADQKGVGAQLADLLRQQGEPSILIGVGSAYQQLDADHYTVNPANFADFQQLLHAISSRETLQAGATTQVRGIVHLWSLDTPPVTQQPLASTYDARSSGPVSVLHLVQAVSQHEAWAQTPRLWLVTNGAQVIDNTSQIEVTQTPLWGMGRVIMLEHPELRCTCIDLATGTAAEASWLLGALRSSTQETQIALRNGHSYVARLTRQPHLQTTGLSTELSTGQTMRDEGCYLITGGLGALGLTVAHWLGAQGARSLVLVGRSGVTTATQRAAIEELQQQGVVIRVEQLDVSNYEEMAQLFASIQRELPPLRGVIHAAGLLNDGILLQQTPERLLSVMAPKVAGTWNLHLLTQELALDFFVCFSSIASLIGSPGQGNYAAANAFMDGLCHYRKARALPGVSINWGTWAEAGMAARAPEQWQRLVADGGITPLSIEQGLHSLAQLLQQETVQVGVVSVNWTKYRQQFLTDTPSPLFEELDASPLSAIHPQAEEKVDGWMHTLQMANPEERRAQLARYLRDEMGKILQLPAAQPLDPHQGFFEMGMDSLLSISLRKSLEVHLATKLPPTLLFKYSTPHTLTVHLDTLLFPTVEEQAAEGKPPLSQGQLSQGQLSQGQLSQGQLSQGQLHEAHLNDAQMPEAQLAAKIAHVAELSEEEIEKLLLQSLADL